MSELVVKKPRNRRRTRIASFFTPTDASSQPPSSSSVDFDMFHDVPPSSEHPQSYDAPTSSSSSSSCNCSPPSGGGGVAPTTSRPHHRPRIKLKKKKPFDLLLLPQKRRRPFRCPQLLSLMILPPSFFLHFYLLLTSSFSLVNGASSSSISSNLSSSTSSSSSSDLLLQTQLNQLVQELAEEESSLLQQDLEESHKTREVSLPPSSSPLYDDSNNFETAAREDNFSRPTHLNSGKLSPASELEKKKAEEESQLSTTPSSTSQDLPNLRPVPRFSSAEVEVRSQSPPPSDAQREDRSSSPPPPSDDDLMQRDEAPSFPSDYPHQSDNNGGGVGGGGGNGGPPASLHEGLQTAPRTPLQKGSSSSSSPHHNNNNNKPLKPHKSLPQPLNPGANDPHELAHLQQFHPPSPHHTPQVIVLGGKSLSSSFTTTLAPNSSSSFNHIVGLTTTSSPPTVPTPLLQGSSKSSQVYSANVKPRRLESLSHGVNKNRIQNSISFDDEPLIAESSAYNSIGDSSSTSNNNGQLVLLQGRRNSSSGALLPGHNPNSGMRRSPLQIRRDLSRLVAAVKDGSTGNGIDDDISQPSKCDRLFISTPNGPRNGSFESPTLALDSGHLYQCIFMFVAKPNERVEITFHGFKVRGTPPECVHEWVDIWTEVEGTDPTDLITTPFSGRYCGKIPPRKRISLYGGIAIGFYSDRNVTDESIFHGSYSFINETRYIVGTPQPRTQCSYTILGTSNKGVGELLSPTYPGVYPKKLSCAYKFVGTMGQRIRIEFRDFDVFFGGAHCPFDDVKIYDGAEPTAPLIGTYCGQQRNLVVYSSEHMMLVTFTTLDRNTDSQNRGFNAVYEFSNGFVKLDFIEKNKGGHIRGTECDQRILSTGQSMGLIYSPNYPFLYLPKIVCRYFVYGLQDPQNLEQVRLSFEIFDVPSSTTSAEDENNQSDSKSRCGDAFLKVYLKGQEVIQAYDKADHEFCGKEIPETVASDGPRLVLVFSSGDTQGSGFKAKYWFRTDYRIPGTQSPAAEGCHFSYNSQSRAKGEFNSPRFPSNYPTQTNCTYIFQQRPNEQVRIVFDNFKLRADKFNYTDRGAYGTSCEEDWVEIWNVMSSQDDRLVGRYCGTTAPGPIESKERATSLKVIMSTDEEGVYSGFKARYTYFTADSPFGNCGRNITQLLTGVLTSPKWPGKYDGPSKLDGSAACNWYLNVRPGSRVMLYFQHFSIEGEPAGRGCPAAAVRIWEDPEGVPTELCGEALLNENRQYVSLRNAMRVTFITADKAVGAPGFQAIWTEVQDGSSGAPCHTGWFRCSKTEFCIPEDLTCDGNHNCGFHQGEEDRSDEELKCGLDIGDMNFIFSIGVGVAVSLLVIIILCAWGQRRRRRRRRRLQLRRPPIHVCDNAGARFAAMDSV